MTRYTRDGKRIVHRNPRHEVPGELLAAINAGAAEVTDLRAGRDNLQSRVRQLEHAAYVTRVAADAAKDPGMRKMLDNRAASIQQDAGSARVKLSRAERTLGERESALGHLHREARAWQRGDMADIQDEPDGPAED